MKFILQFHSSIFVKLFILLLLLSGGPPILRTPISTGCVPPFPVLYIFLNLLTDTVGAVNTSSFIENNNCLSVFVPVENKIKVNMHEKM